MNRRAQSGSAMRVHSVVAKGIHWGFTLFVIYAFTKQLDEVDELEDLSLLESEIIFASVFLVLLVARFVYMQRTTPTILPADTPIVKWRLARSVHLGMYAGLAMIAVSGLWIGGLYWGGTKSGGQMDFALLLHEIGVNSTYLLVLAHVGAALFHRRQRDGIWNSMVPFWREPEISEQ